MPVTLPEQLLQAVIGGKCILFVGSGLSRLAGYPSWGELVAALVDAAKQAPFARVKGIKQFENDPFVLAEFARSTLGTNQYTAILRQHLARPVIPAEVHRTIARTGYRGLITTNYDKLLETTVTQVRHWTPLLFTSDAIGPMGTALYNPEFFIFKLHGDIDSPESIVLTKQDYDRLILHRLHVRNFLQAVFLNYTLLFVGYSLKDPDFQLVLSELTAIFQGYLPTHYALIPDAAEFTVEHLMKQMNIQAIPYSPRNDHAEIAAILAHLQQQAPARIPEPTPA